MDFSYPKEREPSANRYFYKEAMKTFGEWNGRVFSPGRLDKKTKELVAVAFTYTTCCPYCMAGHTKAALEAWATKEEIVEVIQRCGAERRHGDSPKEHSPRGRGLG